MVADAKLRELIRNAPKDTWALIDFLRDGLAWPLPDVTHLQPDDILIDWKPEELHLDPTKVAKLIDITQLPPLTAKQNFGVFFLNFDGRNLPITAVRRLVHRLVSNKRGHGAGTHPTWALDDFSFSASPTGTRRSSTSLTSARRRASASCEFVMVGQAHRDSPRPPGPQSRPRAFLDRRGRTPVGDRPDQRSCPRGIPGRPPKRETALPPHGRGSAGRP